MSWRRVVKSLQVLLAHGLLFSFTLFLSLKIHRTINSAWWLIFSPLWLSHAVTARGIFYLPAPTIPHGHGRHWAPFLAIMATPLVVAFELHLCVHLEKRYAVPIVHLGVHLRPILDILTGITVSWYLQRKINKTDDAVYKTLQAYTENSIYWFSSHVVHVLGGNSTGAKYIPVTLLFSPLLLLQGAGFLFAIYIFLEKISSITKS